MRRTVVLTAVVFGALGALGIGAQRSTRLNTFTLPVGGGAVTIGDLNSDGKPDIVTIGSDAVAVYFGDGRGRFEQPPGSPFAAGKNPNDVTLTDFNEDGRLDVAVANHETSYLRVLLGSGDRLAPPIQIAVQSRPHPHGVAAGDFNRDRHVDLAVESWAENVLLVLNGNGKGRFANEARHPRMSLLAMWTETGLTMWPLRTWGATTSRCSLEADREFALLEAAHCLQAQRQRRSPSRI
jgi:hypothetical protein